MWVEAEAEARGILLPPPKKNSPTGKIPQENPCQKNSLSCVLGDVVALEP